MNFKRDEVVLSLILLGILIIVLYGAKDFGT